MATNQPTNHPTMHIEVRYQHMAFRAHLHLNIHKTKPLSSTPRCESWAR
jgi:hypothetical protein